MNQHIDTKFKQLFSRIFRQTNSRRSARLAARKLQSEALEPRMVLDAAAWTAAGVVDDASAFFDDSYVHDLYITFDDADWYNTLYNSHANDADDPYFAADFSADGVTIENVGVRFKGNSSFSGNSLKKSIKIDFDEFDEDNDELTFLGLKKLNLNNNFNDPSQLREKLFLDYASNFAEGVSRAVHTNVYINGDLWGLYTAVEQIDKTFVQNRFGSDEDGNLFKGSASDDVGDPSADFGSDLTWLGTDPDDYDDFYQLKTNETAYDYSDLIEFIDVLNNTPTASLPAAIEPLLDVQDTLAGLAINNLFSNLDSYTGAAHNYYLYDRDDTGQFTHVLWDSNESFGTFSRFTARGQDMAELDPFWVPVAMGPGAAEERPLMENLWAVDEYSDDYLRDLAEMLRTGFDVTSASARIEDLADLIRSDVYAEPYGQFTNAQFETNLDNNVSSGQRTILGLTSFIEDRSNYLNAALSSYADTTDLTLNELMSVNLATVQDEAGDYDPWIEIYNYGPSLVDYSGLYLTDDAADLTKWALPSGDLDDGEFLTLWVDGETSEGTNHASFALSATGGTLQLTDGTSVIDTVTYEALGADMSLARVPDGGGDFEVTDQPTFGSENLSSVVVVEPVELYINEFMADNATTLEDPDDPGSFDDWIELYNPGAEELDLGGMYLTDDLADTTQWQFADGTTIAAGGYLIVWADDDAEQGATHTTFKLSSGGEEIGLYHIDGTTLIDSVVFGAQTTDVSYGRVPDGSAVFAAMTTPTPGASNVATSVDGDFDDDGDYDVIDIDALTTEIAAETHSGLYDLTGDGIVDLADLYAWLAEAGAVLNASGNPFLIGDSNLDGSVDVTDYVAWNAHKFTNNSLWSEGDFNADGVVDVSDLQLWNANKFQSADSSQLAPPSLGDSNSLDSTRTASRLTPCTNDHDTSAEEPSFQREQNVDSAMSQLEWTAPRRRHSRFQDAATGTVNSLASDRNDGLSQRFQRGRHDDSLDVAIDFE